MNDEDGALHGDREVRKMSTSENYLRDGRDLWRMIWLPGRVSGWTEKSENWDSVFSVLGLRCLWDGQMGVVPRQSDMNLKHKGGAQAWRCRPRSQNSESR